MIYFFIKKSKFVKTETFYWNISFLFFIFSQRSLFLSRRQFLISKEADSEQNKGFPYPESWQFL